MNDNSDLDLGETLRGFRTGQHVFNRYVLARQLGRGGMGVVWLARDETLGRDVALKFLPEVVSQDRDAIEDMKRETRRSLELTHPRIVRIYDFVSDGRSAAVSMEYVEGETLSSLKYNELGGVFPVGKLAPWVEELCEALTYAHGEARIVHRDLKPANLMIDKNRVLKVADFGISATLSDSTTRASHSAASSSGTPVYMSPQQMMGEKPSPTDDIYSLGATLYDLLTGKPPFYSGNIPMQVQRKIPPSMTERRKELGVTNAAPIPETWEKTVAACLAKNAADRPQSVTEVRARLNGKAAEANKIEAASEPTCHLERETPGMKAEVPAGSWLMLKKLWFVAVMAIALVACGLWYGTCRMELNRQPHTTNGSKQTTASQNKETLSEELDRLERESKMNQAAESPRQAEPKRLMSTQVTFPWANFNLHGAVNDYAGMLSSSETESLEAKLDDYNNKSGNLLILVTIKNLSGGDIDDVANTILAKAGIGQRDRDKVVVLLVALDDRKLRIEVGNDLAELLTNRKCEEILNSALTPAFRAKMYYAGVDAAFSDIATVIGNSSGLFQATTSRIE